MNPAAIACNACATHPIERPDLLASWLCALDRRLDVLDTVAPEARRPDAYNVRAMDIVIPDGADWKREMEAAMSLERPWVAEPS